MKLLDWPTRLLLLSCLLAAPNALYGAIIASEDFSYADTPNLDGANGGTGFGTAWSDQGGTYEVLSGEAVGTGNYRRDFDATAISAWAAEDVVWGSFDMQVVGTIQQWAGLSIYSGGSELSIVGDWFNQGVWSMDWKSPQSRVETTIAHDGTDRTAVIKFDIANQQIDVWVGDNTTDPIDVAQPSDMMVATSTAIGAVDGIRLGSNGSVTSFDLYYDNIVFATSFEEVGAIPEPATCLLLGVAGLGVFARRR